MLILAKPAVVVPPAETTTLNPADRVGSGALSPDNLTITFTGGSGGQFIRSVASRSSGKVYVEYSYITGASGQTTGVGFASSLANASSANSTINTIAAYGSSSGVLWNSGNQGASWGAPYGPPIVICAAADFAVPRFWFRRDAGLWNNSATANPATDTGGVLVDWASTFFGWLTAAPGLNLVWTANFGATPYAYTPPQNFGPFTA